MAKDNQGSLKKLLKMHYKKTKWAIELWTLKQKTETGDNQVTIKERFSLLQNKLFSAEYNKVPPVPPVKPVWAQYSPVQSSIAQYSPEQPSTN